MYCLLLRQVNEGVVWLEAPHTETDLAVTAVQELAEYFLPIA